MKVVGKAKQQKKERKKETYMNEKELDRQTDC